MDKISKLHGHQAVLLSVVFKLKIEFVMKIQEILMDLVELLKSVSVKLKLQDGNLITVVLSKNIELFLMDGFQIILIELDKEKQMEKIFLIIQSYLPLIKILNGVLIKKMRLIQIVKMLHGNQLFLLVSIKLLSLMVTLKSLQNMISFLMINQLQENFYQKTNMLLKLLNNLIYLVENLKLHLNVLKKMEKPVNIHGLD